jgi:hypothetical protein
MAAAVLATVAMATVAVAYARVNKLGREPDTIDSIKYLMDVLNEIREREASIDLQINPIMEMYVLLEMYLSEGYMSKDEMDSRAMLRANWMKLRDKAEDVTEEIAELQAGFRKTLLEDVKAFKADVGAFRADFVKNGPMVAGISPEPASLFFRRVMLSGNEKLKTMLFHSQAVTKWIKDNSELLHGAISVT